MCMHVKSEDSLQILVCPSTLWVLELIVRGSRHHCLLSHPAGPVLCFFCGSILLFSNNSIFTSVPFLHPEDRPPVCALYSLTHCDLFLCQWQTSCQHFLDLQLLSYSISCRAGFFVERRNMLDNMLLSVVSLPTHLVSLVLFSPTISWDHIMAEFPTDVDSYKSQVLQYYVNEK